MSTDITLPNRLNFPKDFVFGVATSSYQIEGHSQGKAGRTHWDDFADIPGNVIKRENGALACDHLNRWETDLDLIKDAHFDSYRFSTSWARIMPEGRGAVNSSGLDFYDRLVDGLLARDLKPALTLYHWELPSTLAGLGGWRNRDIANWMADFAEVVWKRLGDRIWSVAPINEPFCVAWLSHFEGHHAPGLRDIHAAAHAMHHVCLAHGTVVSSLRGLGADNIGGIFNFEHVIAEDDSDAASTYDAICNRWFVEAIFKKAYPEKALSGLAPYLPKGWEKDFHTIGQPLDWCGVNYYTCKRIVHSDGAWPNVQNIPGPLPKTAMGWEIYPEGLLNILLSLNTEYSNGIPIYITENGMASDDVIANGTVSDLDRLKYHRDHLLAVQDALSKGVPLKGYFAWSLMDNFEWAFGYSKRFGLVHVDFESLKRTPKTSYMAFARALAD